MYLQGYIEMDEATAIALENICKVELTQATTDGLYASINVNKEVFDRYFTFTLGTDEIPSRIEKITDGIQLK